MLIRHIALLVLITALWGLNYVAIKLVLNDIPPVTFSALRFFAVTFPAILFVPRPQLQVRQLMVFGLLIFAGQFVFLFSAMQAGLSAGLASLIMQLQTFFTLGLAVLILRERLVWFQWLGALAAFGGLFVIGYHTGGDVTLAGLMLVIIAALSAAGGNIFTKTLGKVDMLGVIVWSSAIAWPPLLLLACYVEGHDAIMRSISNVNQTTLWSAAYIVYLSTLVGFTVWGKMLARYPASVIAPFSLLVPVFGMLSASLLLDESYPLWKLSATLLVLAGLCLNLFGAKLQKRTS